MSIRYTDRFKEAGIEPSVGSVGDSYDNALAEIINGLYKTELTGFVFPETAVFSSASHARHLAPGGAKARPVERAQWGYANLNHDDPFCALLREVVSCSVLRQTVIDAASARSSGEFSDEVPNMPRRNVAHVRKAGRRN